MLVYGDRSRTAVARDEVERLRARLTEVERLPDGLERHAALVAALIACGELAQGLADAAFEARGEDAPDRAADLALATTRALAEAVARSWREGFQLPSTPSPSHSLRGRISAVGGELTPSASARMGPRNTSEGDGDDDGEARAAMERAVAALQALALTPLPEQIACKIGEGYAFYALYPETYAEAAARIAPAPTLVVGLRSIGTSLGAVVAAQLGAERLITVRPTGHPFRRELRVAAAMAPSPGMRVAVVDEGPGLSGSSFGAALDWAEAAGVPGGRLVAFPSHAGDLGPEASEAHRRRWAAVEKPHVGFDEAILPRLADWVADLTGAATEPLQDISGGGWRTLCFRSEADWPAVNAAQERRKFLLRSDRGAFLLKFAGLGSIGERKLARARRLAAAGYTPEPLGLRHGFLVEPWIEAVTAEPEEVLPLLGTYLRFVAAQAPEPPEAGASPAELLQMLEVNAAEALGPDAADALAPWRGALPEIEGEVRRVQTDNRLHRHEWLRLQDGRVLKTDALDHAESHDLIGAQDVAWDVAGAAAEFDLDEDAVARLWREVDEGRRGHAFLRFHQLAYLAFQLGSFAMAADAHAGWPAEAARLARARDRYAEKLRRTLQPA